MTATLAPAGPFQQAANLCFLFVGLWGDVLLIRLFLVLAYCFLLVGAATGYPRWSGFSVSGAISVDGLVWSAVCLLLHGYALVSLLWDERHIKFKTRDERQLWRFFYRRSGMGRLEMQEVLKYGHWMHVKAGQQIVSPAESKVRLFLLVEGQAAIHTSYYGIMDSMGKLMLSGSVFDLVLLNVLGVFIGFEASENKTLCAVAHTDCLLYSWSTQELNIFATQLSPALSAFWRNFALSQLGMEFAWRSHEGAVPVCATGDPERPGFLRGERSRDFTDSLRPYERQRRTVKGFLHWLWRSLHPLLPAGIRHTALPVNGILARNRVVAVKAAEAWAALSREPSTAGGRGLPGIPWTALQPAATLTGGTAVHRLLRRLQSMRHLEGADMDALAKELAGSGDTELMAAVQMVGNSAGCSKGEEVEGGEGGERKREGGGQGVSGCS